MSRFGDLIRGKAEAPAPAAPTPPAPVAAPTPPAPQAVKPQKPLEGKKVLRSTK
tara:strand:+ start:537 stop:698 length:162 start_codon:yes stop_codon:yes gene_type:complete